MTSHFQVSKACASVVRAALTVAIMTISSMAASTSVAVPIGTYMYGLDDSGDIYEINPATQTTTKVFTSPPSTVLANSTAYDDSRGQLFFIDGASGLNYWQRGASDVANVTGAPVGVSADPFNAAYYNNAIYFFEANTANLKRANLAYTASGSSVIPSITSVDTFVISGMSPTGNNTNTFGDIAIDTNTGTLYASTSRGRFYSLSLADPENSFNQIAASLGNDRSVGYQLAFSSDNSTLYGHRYSDGSWVTIDTTTGAATAISGFVTTFGNGGFRDLGGSALNPVPEPSTIGLAAVGALAGLGWTLRRRLAAQCSWASSLKSPA
jgi:hypothetical protein